MVTGLSCGSELKTSTNTASAYVHRNAKISINKTPQRQPLSLWCSLVNLPKKCVGEKITKTSFTYTISTVRHSSRPRCSITALLQLLICGLVGFCSMDSRVALVFMQQTCGGRVGSKFTFSLCFGLPVLPCHWHIFIASPGYVAAHLVLQIEAIDRLPRGDCPPPYTKSRKIVPKGVAINPSIILSVAHLCQLVLQTLPALL